MLTDVERQRLFNVMDKLVSLSALFIYANVALPLDHRRILPLLDKQVDEAEKAIREYKYLKAKEVVT